MPIIRYFIILIFFTIFHSQTIAEEVKKIGNNPLDNDGHYHGCLRAYDNERGK